MSVGSRVSIPSGVRKTIEGIKEIAGKHSEDDIYLMLKECNMDPDETAQKLLYLDTFHEVKGKRVRRKALNESSRTIEECRWRPGMRWREAKAGQGNYTFNSSDGGRSVGGRKENGVISCMDKGSRPPRLVPQKTDNNAKPRATNSSTVSGNGPTSVSSGSATHGSVPQPQNSLTGTYSSAPDPVLMPPANSHNPAILSGSKSSTGQDVANSSQATVQPNKTRAGISGAIEKSELSEISEHLVLPTQSGPPAVISNHDHLPSQQQNDPSRAVAPEIAHMAIDNSKVLPGNGFVLGAATIKLDKKLEKLNVSHRPVKFPDHLQVPDAIKNQLIFGSLNVTFVGNVSTSVAESVQDNDEDADEPSLGNQCVSSVAQEDDCLDQPQAPYVPENLSPIEEIVGSGPVLKYDLSKQEMISSSGGPEYQLLQPTPEYNFGLVPPVVGPHIVQPEGPKLQSGNFVVPLPPDSTPPATQPMGIGQSSIPVPPHLFHLFRHPYPPNYIPYSPYFPHVYLAQNAHQFFGQNGFPQPTLTGNVYVPSAAAAPGVKFPVPSPYKPGADAGLTPLGIPSSYGLYGSLNVGYSPSASMIPTSSAGTEELADSGPTVKNILSMGEQAEDSHARIPTPGRDVTSLQHNYLYNLPQVQHFGFLPAQASHGTFTGIYHPSQTMPAPPTLPPLMQKSQPMAGSVESAVPPSVA